MIDLKETLPWANALADDAAKIIMSFYEQELEVDFKGDDQPVTEADRQAEKLIRAEILKRFPDHGVLGEEYGMTNPDSEYLWTIDPVDGTNNFALGIPTFGSLLGLRYRGEAVLGVIDHPALNIRCSGARGLGTVLNGKPVTLKDPQLSEIPLMMPIGISTRLMFDRTGDAALFDQLIGSFPMVQIYYDCFSQHLTIKGGLVANVEVGLKLWDLTPCEILIREAGGVFENLKVSDNPDRSKQLYAVIFGAPSAVKILKDLSLKTIS